MPLLTWFSRVYLMELSTRPVDDRYRTKADDETGPEDEEACGFKKAYIPLQGLWPKGIAIAWYFPRWC
ncbi:MAG: hypothetical protein ACYC0L_03450 [Thermoleophilia bacterium]